MTNPNRHGDIVTLFTLTKGDKGDKTRYSQLTRRRRPWHATTWYDKMWHDWS